MALFDFASIGKDLVAAARKKQQKGCSDDEMEEEEANFGRKSLEDLLHDSHGDVSPSKTARTRRGRRQSRERDSDDAQDDIQPDILQADLDALDSGIDRFTDDDDDDEDEDDNDPAALDDARSTSSARSARSLGQRLIRKMSKKSLKSHKESEGSVAKKSLKSRRESEGSVTSTTSSKAGKPAPTFESITMELSNELALNAQKQNYGPAFRLLKTMNRQDREAIMEMLLIRRKGPTFNDETDAYDILFKRIFGIRARTNTALRAARVLSQSTWIHTLLKVATALNFSAKMVIASGDWRLPTRLTTGVSDRAAKKGANAEFLSGHSPVLIKAERKFYRKLQRNLEARLGAHAVKVIRGLVYEQLEPELRKIVFGDENITEEDAIEPMDDLDSSHMSTTTSGEDTRDDPLLPKLSMRFPSSPGRFPSSPVGFKNMFRKTVRGQQVATEGADVPCSGDETSSHSSRERDHSDAPETRLAHFGFSEDDSTASTCIASKPSTGSPVSSPHRSARDTSTFKSMLRRTMSNRNARQQQLQKKELEDLRSGEQEENVSSDAGQPQKPSPLHPVLHSEIHSVSDVEDGNLVLENIDCESSPSPSRLTAKTSIAFSDSPSRAASASPSTRSSHSARSRRSRHSNLKSMLRRNNTSSSRRTDEEDMERLAELAKEEQELRELKESFQIPQIVLNIERVKPGFGKFVILLLEVFALRAKVGDKEFAYADKKDMLMKMAVVGAKDGIIGLSLGVPMATFVNPFLGFPLMGMSFINLSMGSTEFNIIEPVCMIELHQLFLAANGTSVYDL